MKENAGLRWTSVILKSNLKWRRRREDQLRRGCHRVGNRGHRSQTQQDFPKGRRLVRKVRSFRSPEALMIHQGPFSEQSISLRKKMLRARQRIHAFERHHKGGDWHNSQKIEREAALSLRTMASFCTTLDSAS